MVNAMSGVPQGSVFSPLLLLLYTSELLSILENKLICYGDDSTLLSIVPSPGVRDTVEESLYRDLGKVSECFDQCGMKLNASESKTMIVSRSRTMHPHSPPLTIGRTVLKEYDDLDKFGVTFDSKKILARCFRGFVLPILEYCSTVWSAAADTHIKLLDCVVTRASFLSVVCYRRQSMAVLFMLYKIRCNLMHPLYGALPGPYVPVRVACGALVAHRCTYVPPCCRT